MDGFYEYERHLPHWRVEEAIYFVTFRLGDSVPRHKVLQWEEERKAWLKAHPRPFSVEVMRAYQRLFPEKFMEWLDAGMGACVLREMAVRDIVEGAMRYQDGERFALGDFVIMPNHLHVLVQPLGEVKLEKILHSWKSFTASRVNALLGRKGALWQSESYDHIVRDYEDFCRIQAYILGNPDAARLRDGEFTLGCGTLEIEPR